MAQKKSMLAGSILLIDELTSKLDCETDRLIHNIIKSESMDYCQGPRLTMKAMERFRCVKRDERFLVW